VLIKDQGIATAYMVEALRIVDAYQFRISSKKPASGSAGSAKKKSTKELAVPPATTGQKPWWDRFWTIPIRRRDREIFA
jgi:hypothetical protein